MMAFFPISRHHMNHTAQIIASYGRNFIIRTPEQQCYQASARKKRVDFACGDWVEIDILNQEQAVIKEILPRQSLLYRQDAWKTKLIAANVTIIFIVLAPEPTPNELFLQRALLAAEAAHIQAVLVLNKADLPSATDWQQHLASYQAIGYPLLSLSALDNPSPIIMPYLNHQTGILLGQSGMGKSTLTNALLGQERARVGDISVALDSGRHTTTHAQLYDLNPTTHLIDSPGLQEFGLAHLEPSKLLGYFPDLRHLIGQCRFHNCSHRQEPGCAVKAFAQRHPQIAPRVAFLQNIMEMLLKHNQTY